MGSMASQINQPHHCLLSRLFGRRSRKTSKLLITGLCGGNSPGTGEFPAQLASNAENVPFDDAVMFFRENICIRNQTTLAFVLMGRIGNKATLIRVMGWSHWWRQAITYTNHDSIHRRIYVTWLQCTNSLIPSFLRIIEIFLAIRYL